MQLSTKIWIYCDYKFLVEAASQLTIFTKKQEVFDYINTALTNLLPENVVVLIVKAVDDGTYLELLSILGFEETILYKGIKLSGKVVHMNPIAENLTGWTQRQALGRPLTEVFHIINAHTREVVANSVEKVLAQGQVVGLAGQTILKSRTGIEYQIEDSAAPIEDEKNNLRGVVLVFRDVTEKYHVEQELLKMRKLESIGVLAGGVAQQLKVLR